MNENDKRKEEVIRLLKHMRTLITHDTIEVDKEKIAQGDLSAVKILDEEKMKLANLTLFEVFRKLDEIK